MPTSHTFAQLEKWKYRELQVARKRGDRAQPLVRPTPRGHTSRSEGSAGCRCSSSSNRDYIRFHAERQAINALCQGFAAYITKLAMVELHDTLPEGRDDDRSSPRRDHRHR